MKKVIIFGCKYIVTDKIYNILKSLKNNQKCIEIVFVLGKETGEISLIK